MLGKREPTVYGNNTLEDLENYIRNEFKEKIDVEFFQSNYEGAIIDMLHRANDEFDGVVINPGAFTHYSYAIHDAIKSIKTKVVEVHISNVHQREDFRQKVLQQDLYRPDIWTWILWVYFRNKCYS